MRIGYHRSHEASVAVFGEDGQPLFAVSEERYSRKKMQGGWPKLVMGEVRQRFDVTDAKAYYGGLSTSSRMKRELKLSLFNARHRKLQDFHGKRVPKLLSALSGSSKNAESDLLAGLPRACVDHHTCHAASAYYQSGFDEAVVLTVDGVGDTYSARFFTGRNGRLTPGRAYYHTEFPVGHNYQFITAALGLNPHRHAGKVTGLSAYGSYDEGLEKTLEEWMKEIWSARQGRPYFFMLHTRDGSNNEDPEYEAAVEELHVTRQERFGDWTNEDLAYAIQAHLEREVLRIIRDNVSEIDGQPICVAGGVFANVKLNKHVKELGFGQIFVQPAMSDAGLAIGGPLYEMGSAGSLKPYCLGNVYLGPEFDNASIKEAIQSSGLEARHHDRVESEIARLLAEGRVVARFDGRMEFGPRALGNRSVLYHASDPAVNDWLNERLGRTEYMPFAPATIDIDADDGFIGLEGCEHTAEFMTITFDCTQSFKRDCPAAVHVDGTARPQIVRKETNPSFHAVLSEYRELTNIGTVINTSFNMHEEPIVCTPEDAVTSFLRGHLDYLAIGPYIVENPQLTPVVGSPPGTNGSS